MIEDTLPRILLNGVTGRYHIQYMKLNGSITISSLSWADYESAKKIADNILTTKHTIEVL